MDKYDPQLINTLAQHRRIILVDYAGVGLSTGTVASSVRQSADDILTFLSLIGEREVDILGFSLGGTVAQLVALNADPALLKVRKLILAGTTPSMGEGVRRSPNADVFEVAGAKEVTIETFKRLFFLANAEGVAAAEQWWARIHERSVATSGEEPATWLSQSYADGAVGVKAQSQQLGTWMTPEGSQGAEGSFERLKGLNIPVLVVNGHQLPNAELLIYPNSSHGAIFQYASYFVQHALAFLSS
ncbi:alpha/beta-hydrolase [Parathielavia appendiculata]|uniref:Alpha/beta-hydrolase n=1 Tax=Parathielavia appendiculata TaxID=2587402 RepID=A0AAN6YZX9_9PEZI|nr:alpha/beta-hydrolase [Parathielavia appendiculata]